MDFLIAVNFVRNMPWTPQWWAVTLATGLRARGHEVRAAVDGLECPEAFGEVPISVAHPERIHLGAHPGRFVRMVRDLRRQRPDRVTVSLTPMVAGDVWIPVEPTPGEVAKRLIRDLRPVSLALELVHHPWLMHEAWAVARAGRGERLGFDAGLAGGGMPRVSMLTDAMCDRARAAAGGLRATLGVDTGRTLAVTSLVEVCRRTHGAWFRSLAAERDLSLVVLSPRPHTVAKLAREAGLHGVIPMTLTPSYAAVMAASDLVLAAPRGWAGGPGSGRWIADAMRMGTPVIADAGAAGAEASPGVRVVRAWAGAIAGADAAWRARARASLDESRNRFGPAVLIERIETLAARVVSARRGANV